MQLQPSRHRSPKSMEVDPQIMPLKHPQPQFPLKICEQFLTNVKPSANNDGRMATSSHAIRRKTGAPNRWTLCKPGNRACWTKKKMARAMLRITIVLAVMSAVPTTAGWEHLPHAKKLQGLYSTKLLLTCYCHGLCYSLDICSTRYFSVKCLMSTNPAWMHWESLHRECGHQSNESPCRCHTPTLFGCGHVK